MLESQFANQQLLKPLITQPIRKKVHFFLSIVKSCVFSRKHPKLSHNNQEGTTWKRSAPYEGAAVKTMPQDSGFKSPISEEKPQTKQSNLHFEDVKNPEAKHPHDKV